MHPPLAHLLCDPSRHRPLFVVSVMFVVSRFLGGWVGRCRLSGPSRRVLQLRGAALHPDSARQRLRVRAVHHQAGGGGGGRAAVQGARRFRLFVCRHLAPIRVAKKSPWRLSHGVCLKWSRGWGRGAHVMHDQECFFFVRRFFPP